MIREVAEFQEICPPISVQHFSLHFNYLVDLNNQETSLELLCDQSIVHIMHESILLHVQTVYYIVISGDQHSHQSYCLFFQTQKINLQQQYIYKQLMSELAEIINDTADKIQSGNINDLKQGLNVMASISKQQLVANQNAVSIPIQHLTQAVQRNIKLNQTQVTNSKPIMNSIKLIANNLPTQIKKQVSSTIRNIDAQAKRAEIITGYEKQEQKRNQIAEKLIEKGAITDNVVSINPAKLVIQNQVLTPLQQSIQVYKQFLDNKTPQVIQPAQIPQTMRLLTNYARIQGRVPIGPCTNLQGSSYVGLQTFTIGNQKQMIPYEKNQVPKTSTPSIANRLQYHANKTINAWNDYVNQQAQFVGFYKQVNSNERRRQFLTDQFNRMNLQTFAAQALATIIHYYVYMPFLKIAHRSSFDNTIQVSLQGYLKNYDLPGQRRQNPLLLTNVVGKSIAAILFEIKSKSPYEVYEQVRQVINSKGAFLKKQVQKVTSYVQVKANEAQAFLIQNGLGKTEAGGVLGAIDWSSVRKKKFMVAAGFKNPQINQIAQTIINRNTNKTVKSFDLSWVSTDILCHDYIWKWNKY